MTSNYINSLINNYKEYELSQNLKNKLLEISYSNWSLEYVNALKTSLLEQVLLTKKHYKIFSLLWWFALTGFILGLIANILYLVLGLVYHSITSFFHLNILFWVIYFLSFIVLIAAWLSLKNNVMRIRDINLLVENIKVILEEISEQETTTLLPKRIKKPYDQGYFSLNSFQITQSRQWNIYNIFKFKKI